MNVLAHGGVAGAIVEASALLALVGLAVAVWYREKKTQERDEGEPPAAG